LVLAITKAMDVELTVTGTGVAGGKRALVSDFYGPLKENTVIAKWSFTPNLTPPYMILEGKFRIDVMFGDGEARPRHPVRAVLRYIHDHIASDVFSILNPYLA